MKKIILVLMLIVGGAAVATEMCARNDTVVVPLDSTVAGTGSDHNLQESIWFTDFPYGRIYGLATCLSEAEGGKPLTAAQGSFLNASGEMLPPDDNLAGRFNQDADGNARMYCWCKMTHPMSSRWVFCDSWPDAVSCASYCGFRCGRHGQSSAALRSGLFGSVGK